MEIYRQRRSARFLEVTALARLLEVTPPRLRPDHGVYAGLSADVARALRALNDIPRDWLWVVENDPIDVKVDGVWCQLRDSGEVAGMVGARREELQSLGVEVQWNEPLLLYEVVR